MWCWAIIDEFGFVIEEGYVKKEDAEKSRKELEETATAKEYNLKYEVALMPI